MHVILFFSSTLTAAPPDQADANVVKGNAKVDSYEPRYLLDYTKMMTILRQK
jgi:hypothetical protein